MRTPGPIEAFKAILILSLSRLVGIGRELLISVAFGFSRATDLFYQVTFPLQGLLTFSNGPFTTSFSAQIAKQAASQRAEFVGKFAWLALRFAAAGAVMASLIAAFLVGGECRQWRCISAPTLAFASGFFTVLTGFNFAALMALGSISRAARALFLGNVLFVVCLLGTWIASVELSVDLLLLSFALSGLTSALAGQLELAKLGVPLSRFRKQALPQLGLLQSLSLSSAETAGFICTQLLVVALAAKTGEGWTSGVMLAQRICTSINGLVISPIATATMLSVMSAEGSAARRRAMSRVALTAVFLSAAALTIATVSGPLIELAIRRQLLNSFSGQILTELLPAFSAWLVPLGLNVLVCRLMFGLGLERTYVAVTLAAYTIAGLTRYLAWDYRDLAWAIYAGAAIETVAVAILVFGISRTLDRPL